MSEGLLVRALGLRRGQAAAAVGAGGKTSLLEAVAAECHAAGWRPALLTTTTKIFAPREDAPLLLGEAGPLARALASRGGDPPGPVTLARARIGEAPVPGDPSRRRMKLDGFGPEEAGAFRERAGMLLIEADGARGLAAKAPGPGEPVIPPWADAVLGVVGLTIIGAPLDEARVFRPGLFGRVTGLAPGSPIVPEAIGRLALHPDGLFKGAAAGSRKLIVLNQGDAIEGLEKLEQIAYIIWRIAGAPAGPAGGILCTSMEGGGRVLHQIPAD
ncbi:MAG: putative selenium-dependent hydroxylase accessory protein YqeC [Candidatus Tectomicrobia bacterium]|nr:putative selenium-dependent hydroxylase accessory protein YqeC [Candidatus Tectomicrobia bacterium]